MDAEKEDWSSNKHQPAIRHEKSYKIAIISLFGLSHS
jgi:hypothetical protein